MRDGEMHAAEACAPGGDTHTLQVEIVKKRRARVPYIYKAIMMSTSFYVRVCEAAATVRKCAYLFKSI